MFRRFRIWLFALLLLLIASALVASNEILRQKRVSQLAADIQERGGELYLPDTPLYRLANWLDWNAYQSDTQVFLWGEHYESSWFRRNEYLSDLSIMVLCLDSDSVEPADAVQLIAQHPLTYLEIERARNADEIAAALSDKSQLKEVDVEDSDLTDAGFSNLPLEELQRVVVAGTRVTPNGLRALLRCGQVEYVSLDGTQLDQTVVNVVSTLPSLTSMTLSGKNVTDEHCEFVRTLTQLSSLHLSDTSVTAGGLTELKQFRPDLIVEVYGHVVH